MDERYIAKLASLPVNARFSPVIEQPVLIPGQGSVALYGINTIPLVGGEGQGAAFDPETLENSAVVSGDLAGRLHLEKGDKILDFKIQTIAPDQNNELGSASTLRRRNGS